MGNPLVWKVGGYTVSSMTISVIQQQITTGSVNPDKMLLAGFFGFAGEAIGMAKFKGVHQFVVDTLLNIIKELVG